jgi:hypothetical protein
MRSPVPVLSAETRLFTYRITWRIDGEFIDHLVVAHNLREARSISTDLMRRALGRRFDRSRVETAA